MRTRKIPKSLRKCETYKKYLCRIVQDKYGNIITNMKNFSEKPIRIYKPVTIWGQKSLRRINENENTPMLGIE